MKLESLRGQIGVVMQDVYMFSGRIRDKHEYGRPGASLDEIKEAARRAGADEFIQKLPDGYDTYVGERGVKLSADKSSVFPSRVSFSKIRPYSFSTKRPPRLTMRASVLCRSRLTSFAKGRTVFTIAHRLTTIKNADEILVLTENGIEERGTHSELLEKRGIYYHLYNI